VVLGQVIGVKPRRVVLLEQAQPVLDGQTLYMNGQFNITGDASPATISALNVTAGFFDESWNAD